MPLEFSQILILLTTAIPLTISPGPDVLGTLSIGLSRGWQRALSFGLGCAIGCLFHTTLAVLGISAIIAASETAFAVLKWCGAGYLAWLGIGALRSRGSQVTSATGVERSSGRYFVDGLVANAINPKVTIFFLSFLQPLVRSNGVNPTWQLLALGTIFTVQAMVIFGLIGVFSGRLGRLLQSRPGVSIWLDRIAGVVFLVLAAVVASQGITPAEI